VKISIAQVNFYFIFQLGKYYFVPGTMTGLERVAEFTEPAKAKLCCA